MEAKTKETKHTPGPWIIQPHSTVDKSFMVGPGIWIDYDDVDHAEQDANAELIAQAPALSERVRELEEMLQFKTNQCAEHKQLLDKYVMKLDDAQEEITDHKELKEAAEKRVRELTEENERLNNQLSFEKNAVKKALEEWGKCESMNKELVVALERTASMLHEQEGITFSLWIKEVIESVLSKARKEQP